MEKSFNKSVQDSQKSELLHTRTNCAEDGSSSTETLSAEERHTLKHTQRQEPQGEEQAYANSISSINVPSMIGSSSTYLSRAHDDSTSISTPVSRNNDSNLSISSGSNTNTLIIHHSIPDQSLSHRWLSSYSPVAKPMRERSLQPTGTDGATFVTRVNSKYSDALTTSNSFNSGISVLSTSLLDSSANMNASALKTPLLYSNRMMSPTTSTRKYTASTELLDIPSAYLDQSEVLKHLIINKETKEPSRGLINGVNLSTYGGHVNMGNISGGCSDQSASSSNSAINIYHNERGSVSGSSSQSSQHIINALDHRDEADMSAMYHRLPPPPAYPLWQLDSSNELKDTGPDSRTDKVLLSKSQPDLTRVCSLKEQTPMKEIFSTRFDDDDSPTSMKELVNILTHENSALKMEIDICHRKVAKLQRFELEMAKVEEQYEALVKLCERREQLERLARHKLNAEVRRLTEQNNELRDHLEILNGQTMSTTTSSGPEASAEVLSLRKELDRRDVFIAQLVSQNKELSASKERQEMELTAQRQTLNEQRTHIDILDSALTNAQTNVVKLEEEGRKKQNLVEQAGQLKRLLLSIKLAADRREQSERNLRQKLEMEILQLRSNAKMDQSSTENSELRRELREKEEKVMFLEGEVTKWEQRFLQESAMRHMAIEAASMPKDAKIAVLERNSQDSERRIAQAESDKMRHVDEINNMNKKISALENRNRNLESHNAEREAMIRALQKRHEEKDFKNQSAMKMEYPITSNQTVIQGSPKHQHSTSVTNISTPSMFPATPRKDEELGNYLTSNFPLYFQPPNHLDHPRIYPETNVAQDSHTRSGSYCCYVTPLDQSEIHNKKSTDKSTQDVTTGEDDPFAIDKNQVLFQLRTYDQSKHCKSPLLHPKSAPGYQVTASQPIPPQVTLSSATSNVVEIQTSRGDPPPYFSHHQVLKVSPTEAQQPVSQLASSVHVSNQTHMQQQTQASQSQSNSQLQPHTQLQAQGQHPNAVTQPQPLATSSVSQPPNSPPLARPVVVCQRPHPPNAFCRTCLNVRRSHRQNAAAFVRRAHSSGYQHNRRSAPSPASSADSLDDAPSILERLKKEWEMGFLGPPSKKETDKKTEGSKTLPLPLGTLSATSSGDDERTDEAPTLPEESSSKEASTEKKDVAHLDRALNRLSMKRSSNPFGQKSYVKNIDSSTVTDIPLHEQQLHNQQQQQQQQYQQQQQQQYQQQQHQLQKHHQQEIQQQYHQQEIQQEIQHMQQLQHHTQQQLVYINDNFNNNTVNTFTRHEDLLEMNVESNRIPTTNSYSNDRILMEAVTAVPQFQRSQSVNQQQNFLKNIHTEYNIISEDIDTLKCRKEVDVTSSKNVPST